MAHGNSVRKVLEDNALGGVDRLKIFLYQNQNFFSKAQDYFDRLYSVLCIHSAELKKDEYADLSVEENALLQDLIAECGLQGIDAHFCSGARIGGIDIVSTCQNIDEDTVIQIITSADLYILSDNTGIQIQRPFEACCSLAS